MKPPIELYPKGPGVEEWLDLRFFRPIGARLARTLAPTRVSPDRVTVWALAIGLIAGHLFVYQDRRLNALGLVLFIVSDLFDSADGQLARLRGTSTRRGRILDGISDNARFVNLYMHLLVRLLYVGGGWHMGLLVAMAGLSHSLQSAAVDFVRNAYLNIGVGRAGELELPEDLEGERPRAWWARFAGRVHRDYIDRQVQLFPRSVRLIRLARQTTVSASFRDEYRRRQGMLLPLCSWLGQNIRFAVVGLAAISGRPAAFLWTEATVFNLLLVLLLLAHEANAAALGGDLAPEANAHAGIN